MLWLLKCGTLLYSQTKNMSGESARGIKVFAKSCSIMLLNFRGCRSPNAGIIWKDWPKSGRNTKIGLNPGKIFVNNGNFIGQPPNFISPYTHESFNLNILKT